ncbi:hypothetical protein E8E12_000206 [Didymella heteroderae]|uniref:Peroxiredoxin n=1 Tax=Didymella heteroderae TaxID=1769908 RepID=A0A9P4WG33_9PLEO|nr:hypothetical protein E8E12_000206 [Didymella heteroderae]
MRRLQDDDDDDVAFVSVDTKHSLWHWQNVPRQYGGLGNTDIPLLSDTNHKIGRDYGVLVEEKGIHLRGMFIIDNDGLVQQITLNNLAVGRSVLEALRLLEAFQAVAKHGVLCPVDWKPSSHVLDTPNTISDTLVESYEERLANLQKEFGDVQVTELDAKHRNLAKKNSKESAQTDRSNPPSPVTAVPTPDAMLSAQRLPALKPQTQERTARHSQGHNSSHRHQNPQVPPPRRSQHPVLHPNVYKSQEGSHVVLEFADPTLSPMSAPTPDSDEQEDPTVSESCYELDWCVEARGEQWYYTRDIFGQWQYVRRWSYKIADYLSGDQEDERGTG